MFLLDTNVISELRRRDRTNPKVAAWIESVPSGETFLSSITVLELETGALLRERRDAVQGRLLREWIEDRVLTSFAGRILPVDTEVARRCARLHVPNPRPQRDSLIAATALIHGLVVATRNPADFDPMAVPVLNPWE
jgi:toxin FitB